MQPHYKGGGLEAPKDVEMSQITIRGGGLHLTPSPRSGAEKNQGGGGRAVSLKEMGLAHQPIVPKCSPHLSSAAPTIRVSGLGWLNAAERRTQRTQNAGKLGYKFHKRLSSSSSS